MAPTKPTAGRLAELLRYCSADTRILEIGPSHSPVAPKAAGWNSYVLDHDDRAALVAKYGPFVADVSAIEEVDFVWRGGKLHHAVPERFWGSFDVLIASHVIEHVPDFIGFFATAAVLLKPGGIVSLAVPDKRTCFDCFRPHTTTGEVLAARGRTRHTERSIFDSMAYYARAKGADGWGQGPTEELRLRWPLDFAAKELARLSRTRKGEYVDSHAGVFTPSSFALLVLELGAIGEMDWHLTHRTGAQGSEFFAHLRRGVPPLPAAALDATRRTLLIDTLLDLQAQTDALLAAEPALGQPSPRPVAVDDPAGRLVTAWAQNFVLAVHHADYERATTLEPAFGDLALACAALGASDRLHLLYCLALLALFRDDMPLAGARFAKLMAEAQRCAAQPDAQALGDEFMALATPHCAALGVLDIQHD